LLDIYAAGSPDCRTHVPVPVLVHMAMLARIWLRLMMQHYIRAGSVCQAPGCQL